MKKSVRKYQRQRMDYYYGVYFGGWIGVLIGVIDCTSMQCYENAIFGELSGYTGMSIFIFGIIGPIIGIVIVYFYNLEIEGLNAKMESEFRHLQNREKIEDDIKTLLVSSQSNFIYVDQILNCIETNRKNQSDLYFVLNIIRESEAQLYKLVIIACQNKDYDKAIIGLRILCEAAEDTNQYKRALNLLNDKSKLTKVLKSNGLDDFFPI